MTFTFVSNYINHHQIPLSDALYRELGDSYTFIQTMPMEKERVDMGWSVDLSNHPYVRCLYEEEEECRRIIAESDVVWFGWSEREDLAAARLASGKTTFRMSERIYKDGQWKMVSPRGLMAKYHEHIKYRKQNVCMLCAGAYTASDFHLIGAYPNKLFKWGYFTPLRTYSDEQFNSMKPQNGVLHIVWAGRFIPWKHPEYVVLLARTLRNAGHKFIVHMLGDGELETSIRQKVKRWGLADYFRFYGYTAPEQVRDVMEKCHIHLLTSNYQEGWGAVLNGGMNSGCVEVASVQAGAVPYLIRHGENGLVYPGDSYEKMEELVLDLIQNWGKCKKMGRAAYETIRDTWNADHAARELLIFSQGLMQGDLLPAPTGPLSKAPVISPRKMYRAMMESRL